MGLPTQRTSTSTPCTVVTLNRMWRMRTMYSGVMKAPLLVKNLFGSNHMGCCMFLSQCVLAAGVLCATSLFLFSLLASPLLAFP
jgi:hypothetical protein